MKETVYVIVALFFCCQCQISKTARIGEPEWLKCGRLLMKSVYECYGEKGSWLLHEYCPFTQEGSASYLANGGNHVHRYSYLWPYSGTLSAQVAIYEAGRDKKTIRLIDSRVIAGLDCYWDSGRSPAGYASYIKTNLWPDRFYDDNIWIGIDFTDLYQATSHKKYLKRALQVWDFVMSGNDSVLGGGIYWCEQKKKSKNTCSNAPGAVFALKLYKATKQRSYLQKGRELYEWTRKRLYDRQEHLYSDNIDLDGHISRAKYSYNSGQMLQAAALLYELTRNERYLLEADTLAKACISRFTRMTDAGLRLKLDDVWFDAVLLRGVLEYTRFREFNGLVAVYRDTLEELWKNRDPATGLLPEKKNGRKWLLAQAAYAEMMARLAKFSEQS